MAGFRQGCLKALLLADWVMWRSAMRILSMLKLHSVGRPVEGLKICAETTGAGRRRILRGIRIEAGF